MIDDNGKGLEDLFSGLCSLWDIDIDASEDPYNTYDFIILAIPRIYVVILPEPADRQIEIANLLFYDNKVLALDRHDLDLFRRCPGGAEAAAMIEFWLRDGTHASAERKRMGIGS